ncbi:MAG: hypothetical protein JST54_12275 [Deltaproteobacteria bacterium]|nr:hypothetical protein [Deltaproteobacteria bacterium]
MRASSLTILLGPALYAALALALVGRLPALEDAMGLVLACALFSAAAIGAMAVGARAKLEMNAAALVGLGAVVGALLATNSALHASLVLVAALGLGAAFAAWVEPRLSDLSVVVTAAVCLALFDFWSVKFGPAHHAATGGFLQRLLLDVPAPDGWTRFLGISDLLVIALLAELGARRGIGRARVFGAGLLALWASLAQAYVTRGAAPALPWIGALFALAAWKLVRPGRDGWLRTARWSGITVAVLAVATVVVRLRA